MGDDYALAPIKGAGARVVLDAGCPAGPSAGEPVSRQPLTMADFIAWAEECQAGDFYMGLDTDMVGDLLAVFRQCRDAAMLTSFPPKAGAK